MMDVVESLVVIVIAAVVVSGATIWSADLDMGL